MGKKNKSNIDYKNITNFKKYVKNYPEFPKNCGFVPYDSAPSVIGGFQAIIDIVKFPEEAIINQIHGTVVLQMFVDKYGNPSEIKIHSSTNPIFNESAINAVKPVKFIPAKYNDKPIGVYISFPVMFKWK